MTPSFTGFRRSAALLLLLLLVGVGCLTPNLGRAQTPAPPVPGGLPPQIEDLAAYVPAVSCTPRTRPGTAKLGNLLVAAYPGTSWGGARACGPLPTSEHSDGRAIDWMTSVRNPKQAAQAKALIAWLLATDGQQQAYANARRLGVMYLIWNNKIWGAYRADEGWRPYSTCAQHPEKSWDSTCHRNHVHLSLSWAGAMGHTSYWTRTVAAPDYGRCRPADLNWAYGYKAPNPVPCPRYPVVTPPKGASALLRSLTRASGQSLRRGSTGSAVVAVQKAIGTTADGRYGAVTERAVRRWQAAHAVTVTGRVNYSTWRALLAAEAPSGAAPPDRAALTAPR